MGRLKVRSCKDCRWNANNICVNPISEDYADKVEDDYKCENYYPINDNELFEVEDDDSERMEF